MGENRTGHQRSRDQQQRGHRANVRMNAEEYEAITKRASAAGMTVPSYLVSAGMEIDVSSRGYGTDEFAVKSPPRLSGPTRRALAAEILGLSRSVRSTGSNLNQLTRYAHLDQRRPDELPETLAEVRTAAAALVDFLDDARSLMGIDGSNKRLRDGLAAFAAESDEPDEDEEDEEVDAEAAAEQYGADDHGF